MPIKVAVIGIGSMGGVHIGCYGNNPGAELVAVCDIDEAKLTGGAGTSFNMGGGAALDFSGLKTTTDYEEFLADPSIDVIDICLPTRLHAPVTIAALQAGKHVLCEKPMAFTLEECDAMAEAATISGKQLLIGHCLRHWFEYEKTGEIIASGEYGKPLYATFHRSGATPFWSWNDWLRTGSESGGVIQDMHVHDVDAALWWFGKPDSVVADGLIENGTPQFVDAIWRYNGGPVVALHSGWDDNGGEFRYAFRVVLEHATVIHDSALGIFQLLTGGKDGHDVKDLSQESASGYQNEIDYLISCLESGEPVTKVTPASSRETLETMLVEMQQVLEKNK